MEQSMHTGGFFFLIHIYRVLIQAGGFPDGVTFIPDY